MNQTIAAPTNTKRGPATDARQQLVRLEIERHIRIGWNSGETSALDRFLASRPRLMARQIIFAIRFWFDCQPKNERRGARLLVDLLAFLAGIGANDYLHDPAGRPVYFAPAPGRFLEYRAPVGRER